eukprot:s223_g58.t1
MLRILATALVLSSAYRGPRGAAQRLRRRRAFEAVEALELAEGSTTAPGAEPVQPGHVFWDLDNKRPERAEELDAAMALLPSFFPEHRLESVRLYASYATLRHADCRPLLESLLGDGTKDFLEDFPRRFPQGALFPLQGAVELRGTLLVAPARPQAADFWLVRDAAQLVAPRLQARAVGTVCIVSDDSDFRQVILDIHHSGWRCAVLCQAQSWTLRKRADRWFDWNHFIKEAASQTDAPRWRIGRPKALPAVDLMAHQKAHKELRWSSDVNRQKYRHLRGNKGARGKT